MYYGFNNRKSHRQKRNHKPFMYPIHFRKQFLILYYKQSGIGSNSCGPDLPEKYRLNEEDFSYDFYLKFVRTNKL